MVWMALFVAMLWIIFLLKDFVSFAQKVMLGHMAHYFYLENKNPFIH